MGGENGDTEAENLGVKERHVQEVEKGSAEERKEDGVVANGGGIKK